MVWPSVKGGSMSFQELKQRHRQERDAQHSNLRLRVHRALSWLDRAEQAEDLDGRFIFLWIAFNAAYATDRKSTRLNSSHVKISYAVFCLKKKKKKKKKEKKIQ